MDIKHFEDTVFDPIFFELVEGASEQPTPEKSSPDHDCFVFWSYGDTTKPLLGAPAKMQTNGSFYAKGYDGLKITRKSLIGVYPLELGQDLWDKVSVACKLADEKIQRAKEELNNHIGDLIPEFKRMQK